LNDFKELRNHYKIKDGHKAQGFSFHIRDYLPKIKKKDNIHYETHKKNRQKAKLVGATVTSPRLCSFIKSDKSRCQIKIITDGPAKQVRCQHHPLKDRQFAMSHASCHTTNYHQAIQHIEVKPSLIPGGGQGVFTTSFGEYKTGDFVTQYSGVGMTQQDKDDNKHEPKHTIYCSKFRCKYLSGITAPTRGCGYGSLINKCHADGKQNCAFVFRDHNTENESVWAVAICHIKSNTELLTVYGNSFSM
jgi:hypothetical protein